MKSQKTFFLACILFVSQAFVLSVSARESHLSDYEYYRGKLSTLQKLVNSDLKAELYETIKGQNVLSYKEARTVLFGDLYLKQDSRGYYLEDTYCEERFNSSTGVGPGRIPNHNEINCEHTWPQSRFSSRQSKGAQKSDLHHLFPVKAVANSTRGNSPFAEVYGDDVPDCQASQRGDDIYEGHTAFEPPKNHKGNVARALFYFSVRYKINITDSEEVHLRKWHRLDPVDDEERSRHEKIYQIQGNRNPFIDDPDLIDQIEDL